MADMVAVVDSHISPQWRDRDRATLAQLVMFNLLTAGVDAHAKNHGLVLSGNLVCLAPAYDLISAHDLWSADRVRFKSSAAVRHGKVRPYRRISGRNLTRTADTLGLDRREFHDQLMDMQSKLPTVFDQAISELPEELLTDRVKRMPEREEEFGIELSSRITMADMIDTPTFHPPSNRDHNAHSRVWVPGRFKDGRWQSGSYRVRGFQKNRNPL